ncbi:hypothetical protein [Salinarimonas ramus]|uniref:Uncharacterized protein n=1 Tax=Salinarimonas ramus TaxID=690164 RepID=A0A917QHQ0_9HYPH|nr:hypothetical protein [Salinarimonas ramus]GGK50308.1 hypothetical protein GCM10011322_41610 [Salinarimonas ramus]
MNTRDLLMRFSAVFIVLALVFALTGAASTSALPGAIAAIAGALALTTMGLAAAAGERRRRPAPVRVRAMRRTR